MVGTAPAPEPQVTGNTLIAATPHLLLTGNIEASQHEYRSSGNRGTGTALTSHSR